MKKQLLLLMAGLFTAVGVYAQCPGDNTPPTVLTQDISVSVGASGTVSILPQNVDGGSTDNCGIETLTVSPSTFDCSTTGPNTVTLTAVDSAGNSSSATATVTVETNCSDVVDLRSWLQEGSPTTGIWNVEPDGSSVKQTQNDNPTFFVSPGNYYNTAVEGSFVVETTVDDDMIGFVLGFRAPNSGTSSDTFNFLLFDWKQATQYKNFCGTAEGEMTLTEISGYAANDTNIYSTFWCKDAPVANVIATNNDMGGWQDNVTYNFRAEYFANSIRIYINGTKVFDVQGNFPDGRFGFYNFSQPNVRYSGFSIPFAASVATQNASCSGVANGSATAYGSNQGTSPFTYEWSTGETTQSISGLTAGTYWVKVTSANCCIAVDTFNILNEDVTAPTAIAQDITVSLGQGNSVSITANDVNDGSYDDCGIASMTVSPSSFSCSDVGPNEVVLTVTDFEGNTSTDTAIVNVDADCSEIIDLNNWQQQGPLSTGNWNVEPDGSSVLQTENDNPTFYVSQANYYNTVVEGAFGVEQAVDDDMIGFVLGYTDPNPGSENEHNFILFDWKQATQYKSDCGGFANGEMTLSRIQGTATTQSEIYSMFWCKDHAGTDVIATNNDMGGWQDYQLYNFKVSYTSSNIKIWINGSLVFDEYGSFPNGRFGFYNFSQPNVRYQSFAQPFAAVVNIGNPTCPSDNNGSASATTVGGGAGPFAYEWSNGATSQSVTGLSAGDYWVRVSSANCCVDTAFFTLVDQDTIPPTPVGQNAFVYLDSNGQGLLTLGEVENGSTDNCALDTLYISPTTFDCDDIGHEITITLTAIDLAGNIAEAYYTALVYDTIAPVPMASDITAYLNGVGELTLSAADFDNGSWDNCGVPEVTLDITDFDCSNLGVNNVNLVATDAKGNTASTPATVTILDTIAPQLCCCKPDTVYIYGANDNYTLNDSIIGSLVTSRDNCGPVTHYASQMVWTVGDEGTNNVTYFAEDGEGNVNSCQTTITVIVPKPDAGCKDTTLYLDANGQVVVTPEHINDSTYSSTGIDTMYVSPDLLGCAQAGQNLVDLIVVSNTGDRDTCQAVVTVIDTISPVAIAQDITVSLGTTGTATIAAGDINDGSYDNCAIDTMIVIPNSFTCEDEGPNTVSLTVVDIFGNTSSTTATVTVELDCVAEVDLLGWSKEGKPSSGNWEVDSNQTDEVYQDRNFESTFYVNDSIWINKVIQGKITVQSTADDDFIGFVMGFQNPDAPGDTTTHDYLLFDWKQSPQPKYGCVAPAEMRLTRISATDIDTEEEAYDLLWCKGHPGATILASNASMGGWQDYTAYDFKVAYGEDNVKIWINGTLVFDEYGSFPAGRFGFYNFSQPFVEYSAIGEPFGTVISKEDASCPSANDGSATAHVSGGNGQPPYTYLWSNGATTPTVTGLSAGTYTVTITASNCCITTGEVIIFDQDTIAPAVQAKDISVFLDDNCSSTIVAADVLDRVTESCVLDTMYLDVYTFDTVGVYDVIITAVDASGNMSSDSAVVTVADTTAPIAACVDTIQVYLDASGEATVSNDDIDNGSADNCSDVDLSLEDYSYTCADLGYNTNRLVLTDVYGNTSFCEAVVEVLDTIAPTVACKNDTVYLDGTGSASVTLADLMVSTDDNCAVDTTVASQLTFTNAHIGDNPVTLTSVDEAGNEGTCIAIVTVIAPKPTAVCKDTTVYIGSNGLVSIDASFIDGGSYADANIDTMMVSQDEFNCLEVGPNSVDLIVITEFGDSDTCTATVTVLDTIAPVAIAQDITLNMGNGSEVTFLAGDVNDGSYDNCSIDTMFVTPNSFSCEDEGPNPVTLTVVDNNGNVSSTTATVTVVLDCVAEVDLLGWSKEGMLSSGNWEVDSNQTDQVYQDRNFVSTFFVNDSIWINKVIQGNITVQSTADDDFIGFVMGFQNPDAPGDTTTHDYLLFDWKQAAQAKYGCTAPAEMRLTRINATGIDTDPEAYDLLWCKGHPGADVLATNASMGGWQDYTNYAFKVAYGEDNVKIWINGTLVFDVYGSFPAGRFGFYNFSQPFVEYSAIGEPFGTVISKEDASCPSANDGSATAHVSGGNGQAPYSYLWSNGATTPTVTGLSAGTYTVTITASNCCVTTGEVIIYDQDTTAPAVQSQDITVYLDNNCESSIVAADVLDRVTENCGVDTMFISQYDFNFNHLGDNTVDLTVIDESGNSTTVPATVTVADTVSPVVVCKNDTVYLGTGGTATIDLSDIMVVTADNCVLDTTFASQLTFDETHVGNNNVTVTSIDAAGNEGECIAVVTVIAPKPTAVCQDSLVYLDASGLATITPEMIDGGSVAAVNIDTMYVSPDVVSCANLGATSVDLIVVSEFGDRDTCTATVMVMDTIAPVLACPTSISFFEDANGEIHPSISDFNSGHADNCGIAGDSLVVNATNCLSVNGASTATYYAYDASGNLSSCTIDLIGVDTIAPEITNCTPITVYLDENGSASYNVSSTFTSTSECDVTVFASDDTFDCSDFGNNTVKVWALDGSGNVSDTCYNTVTVLDTFPADVLVQDITVYVDNNGSVSIEARDIDNGSNDNCGIDTLFLDKYDFDCSELNVNTVTLTVVDNNGNISYATAIVTALDTVSPTVTCKTDTVYLDQSGNASITDANIITGTNDNCSVVSQGLSQYNFTTAHIGSNPVTATVTDASGNTGSCVGTIIVVAPQPVAVCQDTTVYLDANGQVSIDASYVDAGSYAAVNIDTMYVLPNNFTCNDLGPNTVDLVVVNEFGDSDTCQAVVTVLDTIAPVVNCVAPFTVQLGANGLANISVNDVVANSSDNCAVVSTTLDKSTFSCVDAGANQVTVTVTDAAGNTSTCTTTITVEDQIAPVAVCQNIDVYLDGSGTAVISGQDIDGGSTDNCAITGWSVDVSTFHCEDLGQNNVVLTVMDAAGNTATCNAVVTVIDTTLEIVIDQPADIALTCNEAKDPATWNIPNFFASSDVCGVGCDTTTTAIPGFLYMGEYNGHRYYCSGTNDYTWTQAQQTAAANGGHLAVMDDAAENAWVSSKIVYDYAWIGYFDQAGNGNFQWDNGSSTSYVNWAASEPNGLGIAQCSNPYGAFTVVAKQNGKWYDRNECDIYEYVLEIPCYQNQLSIAQTGGPAQGTVLNAGTHTITYTVTDALTGLSASTSFDIEVEPDTIAPIAKCKDITVVLDSTGNAYITGEDVNNGSTDECSGIETMSVSPNHFTTADEGVRMVTLSVRDSAGNVGTCMATVNIVNPNGYVNNYCENEGQSTAYEWINEVEALDLDNWSGNDGGYGDYTNLSLGTTAGSTVNLTLTPGYAAQNYEEFWVIYLDLDRDGEFQADERVFRNRGVGEMNAGFTIPPSAATGATRMRVMMKWGCYPNSACETVDYGEVEDYTFHIMSGPIKTDPSFNFNEYWGVAEQEGPAPEARIEFTNLYPNPVSLTQHEIVTVEFRIPENRDNMVVRVIDIKGGATYIEKNFNGTAGVNEVNVEIAGLANGVYMIEILDDNARYAERFVVLN